MFRDLCEACPLRALVAAFRSSDSETAPCRKTPHPRWLKPKEAAARMGVSVKWLERRRHLFEFVVPLPHGRGWRVLEECLERYLSRTLALVAAIAV